MSTQNEIIESAIREAFKQKEILIKSRLNDLIGNNYDYLELLQGRFPKLICESHSDGSEHYYYNNGTRDGVLLISFFPSTIEDNGFRFNNKLTLFTYK